MKGSVLLGCIVLTATLVMATTMTSERRQSRIMNTQSQDLVATTQATPTASPDSQAVTYKIGVALRSRIQRILWISIDPDNFTRDKMSALARQLNKDFPDEPRMYAVIFDSEDSERHYNPAGGSYYVSKRLERGEYYLDRAKGRESINFSSQRGKPVNEIEIVLSDRHRPAKKKKRASR
jgi:hypothetical protein